MAEWLTRPANPVLDWRDIAIPFSTGAVRGRTAFDDYAGEMSRATRHQLTHGVYTKRDTQFKKVIGVVRGAPNPPTPGGKLLPEYPPGVVTAKKASDLWMVEPGGVITLWVEMPDKVHLPVLSTPGTAFGLDAVRMYRWWQVFCTSPRNIYRLLSRTQNCAGVIARALQAGGGELYAPMPDPYLFMEPNHIRNWALAIQAKLDKFNKAMNPLYMPPAVAPVPRAAEELMSVRLWMDKTNRGVLSHRGAYVRQIDRLLTRYWASAGAWTNTNYEERVRILGQILDQIHKHLVHRPHSSRTDPALELGEQILATVRRQARVAHKGDPPIWAKEG
jgi:hypothetical protein